MRREPFTWQARRIADKHTTKVVIFTGVLFAALSLWTRNNYWLNLSVTTLFVTLLTWFTLHLGKFDDED